VQFVRGYSPLQAGLALMPFAFMLILVAPRSAKLGERFGLNAIVVTGFCGMTVGFILFSLLEPDSSYWEILAGLIVLGGSMGITAAPATGAIMSSVPLNRAGVGSAVNDTSRELGGALGIAVLGSIATSTYRSGIDVSGLPPAAAEAAGESVGAAERSRQQRAVGCQHATEIVLLVERRQPRHAVGVQLLAHRMACPLPAVVERPPLRHDHRVGVLQAQRAEAHRVTGRVTNRQPDE
jgi:MFS family permease